MTQRMQKVVDALWEQNQLRYEFQAFDKHAFFAGIGLFIRSCQQFDLKRPLKLILPTADGGRVVVDPDDGVVLIVAGEEP